MPPASETNDEVPRGWGFQEIGWLLSEVESAGGAIPDCFMTIGGTPMELDAARRARLALGRAISMAFTWERIHPELTNDARSRKRVDDAAKISAQMRRVVRIMKRDKRLVSKLFEGRSVRRSSSSYLIAEIMHIERNATELSHQSDPSAPLPDLAMTAQQFLFDRLARVYQRHLEAEPAEDISRTWSAHHGPFVAYVRAAFVLEGRHQLSDESLTKALQRTLNLGREDKV